MKKFYGLWTFPLILILLGAGGLLATCGWFDATCGLIYMLRSNQYFWSGMAVILCFSAALIVVLFGFIFWKKQTLISRIFLLVSLIFWIGNFWSILPGKSTMPLS